jgi:hypothetical protein
VGELQSKESLGDEDLAVHEWGDSSDLALMEDVLATMYRSVPENYLCGLGTADRGVITVTCCQA